MCREYTDAGSCQSDQSCFWDANYQSCKFNRPRNGRPPGPAPNQFNPYAAQPAQGAPPAYTPSSTASAPASPPPMMEAI